MSCKWNTQGNGAVKIFPTVNRSLLEELKEEADRKAAELDSECVDLADTITQWQAAKLKLAEQMRRRKDD